MTTLAALPVVVIGAGPVGLSAAAHLRERNLPFVVLEASTGVADSFRSTGHVRLFSPWKMNIDGAAMRLLESRGFRAPDPDALPTAGELRAQYLEPLAAALAPHVRYNARVQHISRRGFDKVKTAGREHAPFVVRLSSERGEEQLEGRAILDASGTWGQPNWMGANGLPARGEAAQRAHIRYGMPDILGTERARYENRRVLVVGSGHSAAGSLIALAELAEQAQGTHIAWAVRSHNLQRVFGGGEKDGLPGRGALGRSLRHLVDDGRLVLYRGFQIEAVRQEGSRLAVLGTGLEGAQRIAELDEIVVATGARPDLSIARELRLRLDPWLESTERLAPLIDPNVHSCGSVPPHGHRELAHPEPGYYAVGAKSYGRAPNFLMATGYEQVRSVVAALSGDRAAADDVQLVLPETGVCSTDFEDSACCKVPDAEAPAPCCDATPKANRGCCG